MIIPHSELNPETLRAVMEDIVTRDGTDYGEFEVPVERKVARLQHLLDSGACFLLYDPQLGTLGIVGKEQVPDDCLDAG